MRQTSRSLIAVLFTLCLAGACAGSATAATAGLEGDTLRYAAAAGETNDLDILPLPTGYEIRENGGVTIIPGIGCVPTEASVDNRVFCATPTPVHVVVELGDGDDSAVQTRYAQFDQDPHALSYLADAGAGDDLLIGSGYIGSRLFGGDGSDYVYGISRDDVLNGGAGNDIVASGRGNDRLDGGEGDDVVNGQEGNDTADGGPGADDVRGGAGEDTLTTRVPAAGSARRRPGRDWAGDAADSPRLTSTLPGGSR